MIISFQLTILLTSYLFAYFSLFKMFLFWFSVSIRFTDGCFSQIRKLFHVHEAALGQERCVISIKSSLLSFVQDLVTLR